MVRKRGFLSSSEIEDTKDQYSRGDKFHLYQCLQRTLEKEEERKERKGRERRRKELTWKKAKPQLTMQCPNPASGHAGPAMPEPRYGLRIPLL